MDAARAPGYHFATLAAAFVQARSGDTVLVRPGVYFGATTSKGLTVVADGATLWSSLRITDLPRGETCVLAGFLGNLQHAIVLQRNSGPVHLHRIAVNSVQAPGFTRQPALLVESCAVVTLTECVAVGFGAHFVDSAAAVTNSRFAGSAAQSHNEGWLGATAALSAFRSAVHLARTSAIGGSGGATMFGELRPGPALALFDSSTTIEGSEQDSYAAGAPFSRLGYFAIEADARVAIDPRIRLIPAGGLPPISPSTPVLRRLGASLSTVGSALGDTLVAELTAVSGALGVTVLDTPRFPRIAASGVQWFDSARAIVLDAGVFGGTALRRFALPIPAVPELRAMPFVLQAIWTDPALATPTLTNASVFALH